MKLAKVEQNKTKLELMSLQKLIGENGLGLWLKIQFARIDEKLFDLTKFKFGNVYLPSAGL